MNTDNKFFRFVKSRGIGFFMLLPATVLAIIIAFVYMGEFVGGADRYWSVMAFLLPLFAAAAFGLCFCKYTARYAGLAMFVLLLLGLLTTANAIYYHIADVVFKAGEGVSVFKAVGGGITFMVIAYILDLVLCAVASFFAQYAKAKTADAADDNADRSEPIEEVAP